MNFVNLFNSVQVQIKSRLCHLKKKQRDGTAANNLSLSQPSGILCITISLIQKSITYLSRCIHRTTTIPTTQHHTTPSTRQMIMCLHCSSMAKRSVLQSMQQQINKQMHAYYITKHSQPSQWVMT
jgi:hypothetical protein